MSVISLLVLYVSLRLTRTLTYGVPLISPATKVLSSLSVLKQRLTRMAIALEEH